MLGYIGHIVATPNALTRLAQDDILAAIQRHQAGDWGDVPEEDRQENELSHEVVSQITGVARLKIWAGDEPRGGRIPPVGL